jgi:hypothetical protein
MWKDSSSGICRESTSEARSICPDNRQTSLFTKWDHRKYKCIHFCSLWLGQTQFRGTFVASGPVISASDNGPENGASMEWYRNTEVLRDKLAPVPPCPPPISRGLLWCWIGEAVTNILGCGTDKCERGTLRTHRLDSRGDEHDAELLPVFLEEADWLGM